MVKINKYECCVLFPPFDIRLMSAQQNNRQRKIKSNSFSGSSYNLHMIRKV